MLFFKMRYTGNKRNRVKDLVLAGWVFFQKKLHRFFVFRRFLHERKKTNVMVHHPVKKIPPFVFQSGFNQGFCREITRIDFFVLEEQDITITGRQQNGVLGGDGGTFRFCRPKNQRRDAGFLLASESESRCGAFSLSTALGFSLARGVSSK